MKGVSLAGQGDRAQNPGKEQHGFCLVRRGREVAQERAVAGSEAKRTNGRDCGQQGGDEKVDSL